jgi:PAS domain S-box-containing protein
VVSKRKLNTQNNFSEEFLRTVFLHAGDGIFLVEDQKIISANPRGCEMFGYSYDEIIGLPLMEQIPADEIPRITKKLGQLAVTKFVISESAFYRKDGSRMAVEISGRMLSNGQILGIMRDITERKKNEELLRSSQEQFRQLVASAPDAVFSVNEAGRIVIANEEAERLLGYSYDELIGMDIEQLVPLNHRSAHSDRRIAYMKQLPTRYLGSGLELMAQHKNGEHIPVDIKLSHTRTETGIHVVAFMRDMSEQKKTERRIRQQAELIDLAYAAVIVLDMQGYVQYWNDSASQLYVWTFAEVTNQDVHALLQTQFPVAYEAVLDALLTKGYWDGELTHICKDGRKVVVASRQALQRDLAGNPIAILEVNLDITERIQKDAELRDAHARILENERMMASFEERERLSRELHDSIGQTLGYINMQVDAIRELVESGDKERLISMLERLSEVAHESHRDIRSYIQELKGSAPVMHQDFFDALDRYCKHYEQVYKFKVELNLPKTLPDVLASAQVETHLIYIIREALGNARRYSGESGASVRIEVDNEYLQVVIEDHGIGFDKKQNQNQRDKESHFGLRIMRDRAGEVGGTVQVESAPGQGTRVIVHLPRRLFEGESLLARVMIVDDHPLFVDGLRNMLAARGVHVVGVANDGLEAQKMVRLIRPDIILMDIHMPRMNGLEATRLIRAELPMIKVAMLTTSMDEEDVFEALKYGASGYFSKGMEANEFMQRLGEIARGEAEFSVGMASQLLDMFSKKAAELAELSERQAEILRLVAQGLTYHEVGDRLYLTERTVKYHMGEILSRLHLKGRGEAEEYAKRRGLV